MSDNNWKVIKIGGSLLSPDDKNTFDYDYAFRFRDLLSDLGYRFSLTTGGGRFTRIIFEKLKKLNIGSKSDLHQVGVSTSNVNNELLRVVFSDVAFPRVLRYKEYDDYVAGKLSIDFLNYKFVIAGSSQPGRSNDWNALQMAKVLGVKELYVLKDIDGIYSSDPKKDQSASLQKFLTWDQYFDIIGNPKDFEPGSNVPIDIFAAKDAKISDIKFYILSGRDLNNVKNALLGQSFHGSIVS